MDVKLFDPTASPVARPAALAPRPRDLRGLRIGLVENTKFNSDTLLAKLAERLARERGMIAGPMVRKRSPSHEVGERQISEFTRSVDVVVSGIGD